MTLPAWQSSSSPACCPRMSTRASSVTSRRSIAPGSSRREAAVSSHDPVTLASVASALLRVGTAACLVPAWRAARADPVTLKGG